MPLIVDPGLATTTSYSARADAVARAALDVRGTTFAGVGETLQDQLLAQASVDVDAALLSNDRFVSNRANDDQALEFPQGTNTTHPAKVVLATQVLAFHLAERQSLGEIGTPVADVSSVKEKTIGELTTVYFDRGTATGTATAWESLPAAVRGLLSAFLSATQVAWGQGRAVRAS